MIFRAATKNIVCLVYKMAENWQKIRKMPLKSDQQSKTERYSVLLSHKTNKLSKYTGNVNRQLRIHFLLINKSFKVQLTVAECA